MATENKFAVVKICEIFNHFVATKNDFSIPILQLQNSLNQSFRSRKKIISEFQICRHKIYKINYFDAAKKQF